MRFSDWQLNRLRDALRAYHQYGRAKHGGHFGWIDVSADISVRTGTDVPHERLRQFAEGLDKKKKDKRKFSVPKSESLEAIVNFVTDERVKLLSKDELEEFHPPYQAPLRLVEYLQSDLELKHSAPTEKLQGRYSTKKLVVSENALVVHELTLQRPSEDGIIQIVETEYYYELELYSRFEELSQSQRRTLQKVQWTYTGWAVLTPEDNLFFFLKNEDRGKNRYYFSIVMSPLRSSDAPVKLLGLLHHDSPIELAAHQTNREAVTEFAKDMVSRNISVFERAIEI